MTECRNADEGPIDEVSVAAPATGKHRALLDSYLMNAHRGEQSTLSLIMFDLRGFLDLGAWKRASDLQVVLEMFLRDPRFQTSRLSSAARRRREPACASGRRGGRRPALNLAPRISGGAESRRLRDLRPETPDGDDDAFL